MHWLHWLVLIITCWLLIFTNYFKVMSLKLINLSKLKPTSIRTTFTISLYFNSCTLFINFTLFTCSISPRDFSSIDFGFALVCFHSFKLMNRYRWTDRSIEVHSTSSSNTASHTHWHLSIQANSHIFQLSITKTNWFTERNCYSRHSLHSVYQFTAMHCSH